MVFFIRLVNLLPISESTRRKSPFYGKSTKKKWLLMKRHAKNSRTLSCPCLNSNRPCAQFLKLRRSCYLLTSSIGFKVTDLLATFIRLSSSKLVQQKQNAAPAVWHGSSTNVQKLEFYSNFTASWKNLPEFLYFIRQFKYVWTGCGSGKPAIPRIPH